LGKTTSIGTVTLIAPTDIITTTGETKTIDGVQVIFQMAPGTEAPSEMLFYFPQFKALCTAEDATHTLHNLLTLRGAQVRNATNWWKALNTSINMFGDRTDVVFASHHWPTWGNAQVIDFLEKQRDLYKYINDQSLRLLNEGYNMTEIAEQMKLPKSLAQDWSTRDHYGSLNHDSTAV
jgi:alkyl sulfatase BDS1-like metallo-beta-lactamase superfamily hydrolase